MQTTIVTSPGKWLKSLLNPEERETFEAWKQIQDEKPREEDHKLKAMLEDKDFDVSAFCESWKQELQQVGIEMPSGSAHLKRKHVEPDEDSKMP